MRATAVLQKCLGSALGSMRALRSRVLSERTLTLRYPHISRGRISDLQPPRVDRSARMAQSSR